MFRSLTPEKQQSLMNRLEKFNSLSPTKRAQVLNRMETYEHLSPAQQKQADTCTRVSRIAARSAEPGFTGIQAAA